MKFDVLTIFPEMFQGPLTESIIKRAIQAGQISVQLHDIRDHATDRHRSTDDTPYGGGAGMVMKPVPLAGALRAALGNQADEQPKKTQVLLMSPAGERFNQRIAEELASYDHLVFVCGRYEGLDERVIETFVDRSISIGDYVLTGGELAAMVILDAVARLRPGVIDAESILEESHSDNLLEYPHYTRPAIWEGKAVPPVLLSGNHGEVAKWRRRERLRRTFERRPDLLAGAELSKEDLKYLKELGWQAASTKS